MLVPALAVRTALRATASKTEPDVSSESDAPHGDVQPQPLWRSKPVVAVATSVVLLAVPHAIPHPLAARLRVGVANSEGDMAVLPEVPLPVLTEGEVALRPSKNEGTVTNALPDVAPTLAAPNPGEGLEPGGPEHDPTQQGGSGAPPPGAALAAGSAPTGLNKSAPTDPASLQRIAQAPGPLPIEAADETTLDAFYGALARTISKEKGAVTRILHYGDSMVTADYISGTLRRRMQDRFGDSGHGFILTANPIDWYFHNDVTHKASAGWLSMRVVGPLAKDGMYGLGGATFRSTGGATATFGTADKGSYGRKVSRFDVFYLEQPKGGKLELTVQGAAPEVVLTAGDAKVSRVKSVTVPDGSATLTVRAAGGGDVRVFGVALERDVPGVTYDALGLAGGRAALWEPMDAAHWAEQFALRKPALIVWNYGTNESEVGFQEDAYERTLGAALDKLKAAAPGVPVLVMAPVDRATKTDRGCAFWNTFESMGGKGTVRRWLFTKPNLYNWDYTHPTLWGAEVIGDLFFVALVRGYVGYAALHPGAPKVVAPVFLAAGSEGKEARPAGE
jgi:hypothetical protein